MTQMTVKGDNFTKEKMARIIEREGLVKVLKGKFILRKSAVNTYTLEPMQAFFEISYSVKIPSNKPNAYLKFVVHSFDHKGQIMKGKKPFLVDFGVCQQGLSLNHEFVKVSKTEKRISKAKASKAIMSGEYYPYLQSKRGTALADTILV
ncbi:MAG: hypothetical protein OEX77_12120 [Candidatus Bathyarchaeota archaeon]|nr:hypothetical protein [Candidatus Bathyarchaeota archaeon]MDH5732563.1 hypothetical protein [Candidatus Bathyarchaeota archaeon]